MRETSFTQDYEPNLELLEDLRRWGDRTSSLMTAYPGFEDFKCGALAGRIRYARVGGARKGGQTWIGATEPISELADRSRFVRSFFEAARLRGARSFLMPVSHELTLSVAAHAHRLCVGAEPIFDLSDSRYTSGLDELLKKYPRARALHRKGVTIREFRGSEMKSELRAQIDELVKDWKSGLRAAPMGFLNQVAPWQLSESPDKVFFVLTSEDEDAESRVLACVTALRVPARNGWYFAEVLRSSSSPSGAMPLLMLGAMEKLAIRGASEVRLGMAPLAYSEVDASVREELQSTWIGRVLLELSKRDTALYGFASAREFKRRLKPSRWEPLYVISAARPGVRLAADIFRAHFPDAGLADSVWNRFDQSMRQKLVHFLASKAGDKLCRLPGRFPILTAAAAIVLPLLHFLRLQNPVVSGVFARNAYSPSDFTLSGLLLGPLFHNHLYHLSGDILSFVIFGGILEWLSGRSLFLMVMAFGFWATNPIAEAGVRLLHWISRGGIPNPQAWSAFLLERDYGSSNGVYAFVGALALFANRRNSHWIWAPFALNGIYLCLARQSWLSLHHLVGLAGGAVLSALWLKYGARSQRAAVK